MSGLWNMFRHGAGFSPEGEGERTKAQNNLGKNRHPYYGTAAQAMLGDVNTGSPKGAKLMTSYLDGQGTAVPNGKKQRRESASGQLLGGGG